MSNQQKQKQPRAYTHVTRVGHHRVSDATGMVRFDGDGNAEISYEELVGYERRAARVVLQELRIVDGGVMRFARKALGLRQEQLARLLDRTGAEVSRYENDARPIPRAIQLAMAELLCRVEADGDAVLEELLDEHRADPLVLEVRGRRKAG